MGENHKSRTNLEDISGNCNTKSAARDQRLLVRWGKSGKPKDDKLKQALLNKIPKSEVANCIRVRDFMHISFYHFSRACTEIKEKPAIVGAVQQSDHSEYDERIVCAMSTRKRAREANECEDKKANPWVHVKCYNYGKKGHRVRDCPATKKRCANCGRVGHKSDICWKNKYPSPIGGTKTTYFRAKTKAKEKRRGNITKTPKRKKQIKQSDGDNISDEKRDDDADIEIEEDDFDNELDEHDVGAILNMKRKEPWMKPQYIWMETLGVSIPAMLDSGAVESLLPKKLWEKGPHT